MVPEPIKENDVPAEEKSHRERNLALYHKMKDGVTEEERQKAREKLIVDNFPLVLWVIERRFGRWKSEHFDDMKSEGTIGLIEGVDRWDINLGKNLSNIAVPWIRQHIGRYLANFVTTVRVPVHQRQLLSKVLKTQFQLRVSLNKEPTYQEIGKILGVSEDRVENAILSLHGYVSLDESPTRGHDDGENKYGLIPDSNSVDPSIEITLREGFGVCYRMVEGVLKILKKEYSPEYSAMFLSRFGLSGGRPKTLEEVGAEFGATKERIRQVCEAIINNISRFKRDLGVRNVKQFESVIEFLSSGVGQQASDDFDLSELGISWSGDSLHELRLKQDLKKEEDHSIVSDDMLVERLASLARECGADELATLSALVFDFGISEQTAKRKIRLFSGKKFKTRELNESSIGDLRERYSLGLLNEDPVQVWERQGKLFPSQIKRAKELLESAERTVGASREAIKKTIDQKFKDQEFYDLAEDVYLLSTDQTDAVSIEETASLLKQSESEVRNSLDFIWENSIPFGGEIRSDAEYRKVVENLNLLRLLISGSNSK